MKRHKTIHYDDSGNSLCGAKGIAPSWLVEGDISLSGLSDSKYSITCKKCLKMFKNRPYIFEEM